MAMTLRMPLLLLTVFLCTACVCTSRGEVGPEVLEAVAWGDVSAMSRFYDRMVLVAADGNCVAKLIADELEPFLWMERPHSLLLPSADARVRWFDGIGTEVERDWIAEVEKRANEGDAFYMVVMGEL